MIHAEITMRSTVLEMDTKVDVLLPEDRHKTEDLRGKKYPVLYVLHGGKEDNSSWINLSNIFLLCRDLDLIVVFPSVCNSAYINTSYGFNYYTYVTEELPTKLKNYLPITDDPKQTFVMGESMGGYGTMRVAFANPDKYGKAVILSAGNIAGQIARDNGHSLTAFASKNVEELLASDDNIENLVSKLKDYDGDKPSYRFYCGTEDPGYEGAKSFAEYVKSELPDYDVDGEYWHGEHNFFFWNEALPKALAFFGFEEIVHNSVV